MKFHRMNRIIGLCMILLIAGRAPHAWAAPDLALKNPAKAINLDDAVRMALVNNHEYRIAAIKAKKSEEGISQAWGQLMPVLESEVSALRQDAESGFMSLSDGQNEVRFLQARLTVNPGIFYNTLKVSRKSFINAREEKRRVRNDIVYSVIKGYFDVLSARETVRMRSDSIAVLRENERTVANMFRAGNVTKYELLQAQVKLKAQEPLLLEAETRHRIALEQFNYLLGEESVRHTADPSVLRDDSFRIPGGDNDANITRLIVAAMTDRPELIQLKMKREISEGKKNISSSLYLWPTFSVAGYYGMTQYLPNNIDNSVTTPFGPMKIDMTPITGNRNWQNTWQVRVAATYRWGSLLPVDPKRSEEREGEEEMKESDEELQRLKRRISISIRSSYLNFVTAYHSVMSLRENVKSAEEGLRVARDSYRVGLIKNSELLSAELDLTSARTGYINAVNQYYISLADLKKELASENEKIIFPE